MSACHNRERISGNGQLQSEERNIRSAKKIKVLGSMDVEVIAGETGVRVEADANLLPYIETEVDDNWLKIRVRENVSINSDNKIKVYVSTPTLTNIRVAGSGDVVTKGSFDNGDKTSVDIAGSGDVTMDVNAPKVDAKIAGSGNLHISGETRDLEVDIAGSGNFDGEKLKAENAKVKIAGSGDVFLFADVNLSANILGSGSVRYKGNAVVSRKVVGSGSISKIP
ncbi:head GIN domain-containing protein [Aridibaculum aurantiacum]|uniref:head GIN domain-containing protein n=1 Tax=Aridibaculum aurantiacum TaxID=2810307 RepID=UPI001A97B918|nr:head GIN domain-containing protein [Aridibaculum aurantiacum]